MDVHPPATRSAEYKPAHAAFAAFACAWVFVLVTLGAFTTSINAGMAFPDWPLSNGSLNPKGWLSDLDMFAEHSHRLSAIIMGTLTLILMIWILLRESRPWLRKLSVGAFGLVILQGIVGGLRVLLEPDKIPDWDTSVGQVFAMLHACLAQAFVCVLLAIAAACSYSWIKRPNPVSSRVRRLGVILVGLLFVQLAIAAVMRHSFAGLAIPYFPYSTKDHGWLPLDWGFKVGIHFAHRVMALVITVTAVIYALLIWFDRNASEGLKTGAALLITLLCIQITLGALIIGTLRSPGVTTSHVLVGAMTLATTFWLMWKTQRDRFQT